MPDAGARALAAAEATAGEDPGVRSALHRVGAARAASGGGGAAACLGRTDRRRARPAAHRRYGPADKALPLGGLGVALARRLDLAVDGRPGPLSRGVAVGAAWPREPDGFVDRAIQAYLRGRTDEAAVHLALWADHEGLRQRRSACRVLTRSARSGSRPRRSLPRPRRHERCAGGYARHERAPGARICARRRSRAERSALRSNAQGWKRCSDLAARYGTITLPACVICARHAACSTSPAPWPGAAWWTGGCVGWGAGARDIVRGDRFGA